MGVIEFFVTVGVLVLLAFGLLWVINYLAPNHPAIIDKIVWVVVILVIVFLLLEALGLLGRDVQIPRIR
jgi:hypothetical protein